jgi:dTDP-4-dehydrorhamnose 3,5-epimerase
MIHYKIDNIYVPENAEAIKWNDLDLNIKWPVKEPAAISEKDAQGKSFKEFLEMQGGLEVI